MLGPEGAPARLRAAEVRLVCSIWLNVVIALFLLKRRSCNRPHAVLSNMQHAQHCAELAHVSPLGHALTPPRLWHQAEAAQTPLTARAQR